MTNTDRGTGDAATTRRMRRIAMLTAIVAIAPLSIVGVVLTAQSWWEGLIVVAGLLIFLVVLKEWSLDGYPRRAVFVLIYAGCAWLVGALTLAGPLGFVPFALIGALLMARLPNHRLLMTIAFSLGVGLVGATALITRPPALDLVDSYILLPIAGSLFIAGVVAVSERSWLVVRRLERAKQAEAELGIAQERMRFAGDLHDIQGHTLHVIKLKTALAQRLVVIDPDRAQSELGEIRRLVDDTIRKTRELAYARHEIEFSAELENARRLCEAAGIDVQVRQNSGPAIAVHPLLSHLLREATTNLLRHASPRHVSITVSPGRVEIENDGVADGHESELRGLARLRARIELANGELHTRRSPGRFTVWAILDAEDNNDSPRPTAEAGGVPR
ncbi:sensor histidine kinase [Cryobacterium lactosi]|uniref:Sensor histidine kinase n=1 Tax=Cryobacterium lactosi TaxID=1259202 RepID=A0A4R9BX51_9MICO|nr:histidine kinase [Cryobacterium lactosi]TFD92085.1 sensor histidine kinase [Cryobacterium lactosi]